MADTKKILKLTTETIIKVDLGDIPVKALADGLKEHGRFGLFKDWYLGGDIGDEVSETIISVEEVE